jgi:hypothetical protein
MRQQLGEATFFALPSIMLQQQEACVQQVSTHWTRVCCSLVYARRSIGSSRPQPCQKF